MATKILAVTAEAFPLAKTGGLGDAVTGMTRALHKAGTAITVMLPAYRGTLAQITRIRSLGRLADLPGGEAELIEGRCARFGLPVILLRNDALYDREGLYTGANGQDYPDNALRFAALAHAATRIAQGLTQVAPPQLIHAHDWHAGLVPLLVRAAGLTQTKTIISLHNLAFQGLFPLRMAAELGIPAQYCNEDGLEFWGQLNFLKAGIRYADRVTTVSQNYAREILTPQFGCGLEGLLQARRGDLLAIANGIDDDLWDPARDPYLGGYWYTASNLANKAHCKTALRREFGLNDIPHSTLLAMGSRLTTQKMADVAVQALPQVLDAHPELQVIIMGCGDKELEHDLGEMAARYPGRCAVRIGFDESMAHRLHAGADVLLHGSRFEPFGLTPLYAMRYGTLPVGSRVGGMADTIRDPGAQAGIAAMVAATGILFDGDQPADMAGAISRALQLRRHRAVWLAMQYNGMTSQFGWDKAASEYLRLYDSLLPPSAPVCAAAPAEREQRKTKGRKTGGRATARRVLPGLAVPAAG